MVKTEDELRSDMVDQRGVARDQSTEIVKRTKIVVNELRCK